MFGRKHAQEEGPHSPNIREAWGASVKGAGEIIQEAIPPQPSMADDRYLERRQIQLLRQIEQLKESLRAPRSPIGRVIGNASRQDRIDQLERQLDAINVEIERRSTRAP